MIHLLFLLQQTQQHLIHSKPQRWFQPLLQRQACSAPVHESRSAFSKQCSKPNPKAFVSKLDSKRSSITWKAFPQAPSTPRRSCSTAQPYKKAGPSTGSRAPDPIPRGTHTPKVRSSSIPEGKPTVTLLSQLLFLDAPNAAGKVPAAGSRSI